MNNDRRFVGVATPQGNPTVEVEFQRFMRGPVHPVFTRLTSASADANQRLVDYMEQMPGAAASFDTLPLRVFAFACTGSSYLLGSEREEEFCNGVMRSRRIPVVTATQAIRREFEGRGARRVAILAPYAQDLCDAAVSYWERLGFDIVAANRIDVGPDTRRIYTLTDADVAAALEGFDDGGADVILLSGTGMPTIATLQASDGPILSSNLCLATEALRHVQAWPPNEAADIGRLCGGNG